MVRAHIALSHWLVVLAALVVLPHPALTSPTLTSTTPIQVGILLPTNYSAEVATVLRGATVGIRAAFASINASGGIDGSPIELVSREIDFSRPFDVQAEEFLSDNPNVVTMAATFGHEITPAMEPALKKRNMIHLGPITAAPESHYFTTANAFIRPDPYAEMVAIATAVSSKYRNKRVAFHYTANAAYNGEQFLAGMTTLMRDLGIEWTYVVAADPNDPDFNEVTEVTRLLLTKPDALISFGDATRDTAVFIATILGHPLISANAPDLKFFATEFLADVLIGAFRYTNFVLNIPVDPTDRILSTFTFPLISDTSYEVIRNARKDLTAAFGATWEQELGYAVMGGYITARFAAEVLRKAPKPLTPQGIRDFVFGTSLWTVDDLTYGVFSDECMGQRRDLCQCNEGAHEISFGTLDANYTWRAVPEVRYTWPISTCTGQALSVQQPLNYLQLSTSAPAAAKSSDDAALLAALRGGKAAAENTSSVSAGSATAAGDIAMRTAATTAELQELHETLLVTAVAHSCFPSIDTAAGLPWPVIDPLVPSLRSPSAVAAAASTPLGTPGVFARNVLLTSSTPEQEIHALLGFVASDLATKDAGITLLAADSWLSQDFADSAAVLGVSATAFQSYGGSDAELESQLAALGSSKPTTHLVAICGLSSSASARIVTTALGAHPTLRIALFSNELHALYPQFASAGAVASRIIVASSLSPWGKPGTNVSTTVKDYHASLPNGAADASPVGLRGFVATRAVMLTVRNINGKVDSESFVNAWYGAGALFISPTEQLGPYSDAACSGGDELCECNVGPRKVFVYSMASATADSTSAPNVFTMNFRSCTVEKPAPAPDAGSNALSSAMIAVIAIGSAIVAVLIVFAARRGGGDTRDNAFAPKDVNEPFTLVFTDIQSSTALWAQAPHAMGPALDAHHAVIRELIAQHKGYEVKTIGDSFMVAFTSPDEAVAMCVNIQKALLAHKWDTAAIDDIYRAQEEEYQAHQLDDTTNAIPTLNQQQTDDSTAGGPDGRKYAWQQDSNLWHGLRVRCGVHTGYGDIKYDEISKGYDYYGSVSNVAARTESIGNGGQVLITEETLKVLKKQDTHGVTDMGPVILRGVSDPVVVFQVDAVPGRTFMPLRLEKGLSDSGDDEDDDETSRATMSETQSQSQSQSRGGILDLADGSSSMKDGHAGSSPHVGRRQGQTYLHEAFTALFSIMDEKPRQKILQQLSKQWHVSVASSPASPFSESERLTTALSKRLAKVMWSKHGNLLGAENRHGASARQSPTHSMGLPESSPVNEIVAPGVETPSPTALSSQRTGVFLDGDMSSSTEKKQQRPELYKIPIADDQVADNN